MAADGYSRMNDRQKFGVSIMQSRAGAENSMGAISQAHADKVPILILLGAPALDRLSIRPEFHAARVWQSITKHS